MTENNLTNEKLEYDTAIFEEANNRASKLLEARIKQFEVLREGVNDGESNID